MTTAQAPTAHDLEGLYYDQAMTAELAELKNITRLMLDDSQNRSGVAGIRDALWEREGDAIAVLLELLHENPDDRIGQNAAYELGEFAYRQKFQQDPRIVPGLLRVYERLEQMGRLDRLWPVLGAIGECVRYEPKPEAQAAMERGIGYFVRDRSLYYGTLTYALEAYLVNQGWKKTLALRDRLAQEPDPGGLLKELDEFLEDQTHVEPGYEPGDLTRAGQGEADFAANQANNL